MPPLWALLLAKFKLIFQPELRAGIVLIGFVTPKWVIASNVMAYLAKGQSRHFPITNYSISTILAPFITHHYLNEVVGGEFKK